MKNHAIIPIFIPHIGCPGQCVFCNQNLITARVKAPDRDTVIDTIETNLSTLLDRDIDVELAFYGGSFTGIPMESQNMYLEIAGEYKRAGKIKKIHMSTRPDYINEGILENLQKYNADTIELGVQSFDNDVLNECKRGHTEDEVYKACDLIKKYDFELGIQLMIGLPGDTKEKAILSAKKAAGLKPSLARLYPTVVLPNTELATMLKNSKYVPLTESEAIDITKEMYKILMNAGITIMRVGLKSTDLMTKDTDLGSGYHPAFRQLVEGEIAKEQMIDFISLNFDKNISDFRSSISQIDIIKNPINSDNKNKLHAANSNKTAFTYNDSITSFTDFNLVSIKFLSNSKWFNPMIGHKACNKHFLENLDNISSLISFPKNIKVKFSFGIDNSIPDGKIKCIIK